MSIANNAQHRAIFLSRIIAIKLEILDLKLALDVAFQARPVPSTPALKLMAEADTHLTLARLELDEAADRVRNLP